MVRFFQKVGRKEVNGRVLEKLKLQVSLIFLVKEGNHLDQKYVSREVLAF